MRFSAYTSHSVYNSRLVCNLVNVMARDGGTYGAGINFISRAPQVTRAETTTVTNRTSGIYTVLHYISSEFSPASHAPRGNRV